MSARLTVLAAEEPAGLVCLPVTGGGALLTVGDVEPDARPDGPWVRWLAGPPSGPAAGALDIAPAGDGLWRRAPWPAADDLFDLAPPAAGAPVVVAGGGATRRGELEYAVGRADVPVEVCERLTREALERAGAVLLLPAPGAERVIPAEAMSVLAARRLLVTPAAEITFGLLPGIDHLEFRLFNEAAHLLAEARRHPAALEPMRVWGAHAAGRHRTSEAIARLEADLAVLVRSP